MSATNAYVLVQTDTRTDEVARSLRAVPGVVFAQDVRGPYDAVAVARSAGPADAIESIVQEIRAMPGVIRALAAPMANAPVDVASIDAA